MIKKRLIRFLFIICVCPVVISSSFGDQDVLDFLDRIGSSLEQKDMETYLEFFAPELREQEEMALREKFEQLDLESVTVFKTQRLITTKNGIRTYLNVLFENPNEVMIEVWRLDFENLSGQLQIKEKGIIRDVRNLYKIRIPSGREERVSRVDIKHADLQITFHNPIVFYDNLPNVDTALLVIGEGELRFSPSLQRERHQLELVFNKGFLQDRLNYVFVRCSNSLFENNIRIEKNQGNSIRSVNPRKTEPIPCSPNTIPGPLPSKTLWTGNCFLLSLKGKKPSSNSREIKSVNLPIFSLRSQKRKSLFSKGRKRGL